MAANDNELRRIELLERTLREIVNLAENFPEDERLQHARVLAQGALNAPDWTSD